MVPTGGPGGAAREHDASERVGERTEALTRGPRCQSQAGARWAGLPAGPRGERRLGRATGLREHEGQAVEREGSRVGLGSAGLKTGFPISWFSFLFSFCKPTQIYLNSNQI